MNWLLNSYGTGLIRTIDTPTRESRKGLSPQGIAQLAKHWKIASKWAGSSRGSRSVGGSLMKYWVGSLWALRTVPPSVGPTGLPDLKCSTSPLGPGGWARLRCPVIHLLLPSKLPLGPTRTTSGGQWRWVSEREGWDHCFFLFFIFVFLMHDKIIIKHVSTYRRKH